MDNVKLALEMSKLVHNECKDVPHDIGLKLIEIVAIHTDTDIQDFAEWCSVNGWIYNAVWEMWLDETLYNGKTTSQLLEDWKVWKEANK